MNRDKQNNTFNKFNSTFKNMNTETFTERKKLLEEFYKRRIQFNISNIEIIQADPDISIYSIWIIYTLKHILHLLKTCF